MDEPLQTVCADALMLRIGDATTESDTTADVVQLFNEPTTVYACELKGVTLTVGWFKMVIPFEGIQLNEVALPITFSCTAEPAQSVGVVAVTDIFGIAEMFKMLDCAALLHPALSPITE